MVVSVFAIACAIGASVQAQHGAPQPAPAAADGAQPSPEEIMRSRHPHPVRVRDLIGLPVLDWSDNTLGYVEQVVRTPDGKVQLVVPYRQRLGWAPVNWGRRTVPVPIETVAMLGPHVAAMEMSREDFDRAPTWQPALGEPIPPADTILVALTKR